MRRYQDMVYSSAIRFVVNDSEAQDIAQEVFLRAYEHFDELCDSPTAGGWLKTVTRNLCLNHLSRYRSRWRFFSELRDQERDEDYESTLAAEPGPEPDLDSAGQRQLLEAALAKLPAAQRIPLVLYHFEDLSYEEIAARLGVSLGKVKTDIHRGREALRRRLTHREEFALN